MRLITCVRIARLLLRTVLSAWTRQRALYALLGTFWPRGRARRAPCCASAVRTQPITAASASKGTSSQATHAPHARATAWAATTLNSVSSASPQCTKKLTAHAPHASIHASPAKTQLSATDVTRGTTLTQPVYATCALRIAARATPQRTVRRVLRGTMWCCLLILVGRVICSIPTVSTVLEVRVRCASRGTFLTPRLCVSIAVSGCSCVSDAWMCLYARPVIKGTLWLGLQGISAAEVAKMGANYAGTVSTAEFVTRTFT